MWSSIDTAPHDEVVLVRGGNMGFFCPVVMAARMSDGRWVPEQWESPDYANSDDEDWPGLLPELWMPVPGGI